MDESHLIIKRDYLDSFQGFIIRFLIHYNPRKHPSMVLAASGYPRNLTALGKPKHESYCVDLMILNCRIGWWFWPFSTRLAALEARKNRLGLVVHIYTRPRSGGIRTLF
ncbi:hypothetical protein NPIL_555281 [Nephila pilipes]|uniref:Uncharacterized protein n=1 Tax=Nephila pilipes TaxID=299642 RepID=A0A8X6TXM3_NEPPI|nr:hypothetical protein NPIL_555281 [Nephila pilipes]